MNDLEKWLSDNNLKMGDFADMIGCHRQTLRAVIQGKSVARDIALTIILMTKGEVKPISVKRGRPKKEVKNGA